jgi:predicted PurR-regulated permease PerM
MQFFHSKQQRAGLLIVILGVAIFIAIWSFAIGLLGSAVLYVMCAPAHRRLQRVLSPGLSATVTLVGTILVIVLPVTWLVTMVIDQAPDAIREVQGSGLVSRLTTLPPILGFNIGAELARASGNVVRWISQQAFDFIGGAARATLNLVIAFFGLYYMLTSAARSWELFKSFLPFSNQTADELRLRFYSVTHATMVGILLTAALQGTMIGVGFAIVGIPNALFWGVMTGFASIIPVLGSALVWLPGAIYMAVQGRYGGAILLFLIGAVGASNIDNVVRPLVFKRVSDIHPMVTLVGAFAGVKYFGLLGVLLGPLAIAYFFELLRLYQKEYGAGMQVDSVLDSPTEEQPVHEPTVPSAVTTT